jgi:hypothetical protein
MRKHYPTYNKIGGAANIAIDAASDPECELMAIVSELFDEMWMLDTRRSYHVTSKKEWFATYKPGDFGAVYQFDVANQHIMGMGDVKIKTKARDELVI